VTLKVVAVISVVHRPQHTAVAEIIGHQVCGGGCSAS
jgi:hypothetical protein